MVREGRRQAGGLHSPRHPQVSPGVPASSELHSLAAFLEDLLPQGRGFIAPATMRVPE